MASSIVSSTIDGEYPVAGVDNDTQGFRDNFTIIKNNFATAASEITNLQENTCKLDESNNFNGTNIASANLQTTTQQYYNAGTLVSGQNISFLNGHFQTIRINLSEETSSISLTLSDWPATDNYAVMRLELRGNDTAKTINWLVENGGTLLTDNDWPGTFTIDSSSEPIIIELFSYNGGTTVYGRYLGRFN